MHERRIFLVPLARALALALAQERESRFVPTEDRARLLPNPLLALGSSVLFKDKAPCGWPSIWLKGPSPTHADVSGDEDV
ncbi:hypothetical protein L207DRAFT_70856 [Hyaloscypha variabilis F]|uniref:Secreted protein n=1 Tax=Hyaloscypha variabilis (strain UAMH 11265 / GT02V1 / F) TaxID=1149755 RepID=A0A2J6RJ82_HYAVF|nr:hypothetical protein L207DRAFT_70856 [Hyaloscypha variabilis F]